MDVVQIILLVVLIMITTLFVIIYWMNKYNELYTKLCKTFISEDELSKMMRRPLMPFKW